MNEEPISMVDLKEELKTIKKRDTELNFRSAKTEEYLNQFVEIDKKDAVEIEKKIEDLNIPRFKPDLIKKIVDILPVTTEEVKIVLQGYTISVTKENMKKIADVVNEATKK